jgi:transposase
MQWVHSRTSHLLAIQNIVARQSGIAITRNSIKRLTPERIGQMGLPGDVALAIESNLATIIALETGSIDRFTAVGHFASYARCVNSQRISNGKKKGEGNVKNGNKYLAWAFVETVHFARRYCAEAGRFYERRKAQKNTAVATQALARKRARACYSILTKIILFYIIYTLNR